MTILTALSKGFDRSRLTYKELGKRMGMSLSSTHKKLTGGQVMTVKEAEKFAKKLGVTISAKLK